MRRVKKIIASISIGAMMFTTLTPVAFADTITSSTVSIRDLTSTSVTVCFTLSGSGYGKVYYGLTTSYGFAFQEEAASDCGKITRLSNLAPGTTYHYKIVSWPANGSESTDGVSSQDYIFSTLTTDTIPPGNVADGKANLGSAATVNSTHTAVTFNWKTPGDDGWHSGPGPARYQVKYQKHGGTLFQSPSDGGYWNSAAEIPAAQLTFAPTLPSTMGTTQSLTISGLEANTTYRFGVLAYDAAGNASNLPGVWDIKTATTPTDTFPPPQVTGLKIDSVANSSLTFSWTAPWDPGIDSTPQPASRYEIRYKITPIETETDWQGALVSSTPAPPTPVAGGTLQSHTINALTPGATYYIAIRAYDAGGLASSLNTTFTGTTSLPDTTPPVISNARATNITQTSVIISFELDEPGKAKVEYRLDGGVLVSSPEITVNSDTLSNLGIYLSNLTKATVYSYQLVATNAVGLKTTLPNLSFTTLSDTAPITATSTPPVTPGAPVLSNIKIVEIFRDGVKIEATTDQSTTLQLEYGSTQQYGTISPFATDSATVPWIEVRGLAPETIYYARAYAKNAQGMLSAPSQQLQFKTLPASAQPTQPPTNNTFPPGNAYLVAVVTAPDGSLVQGATVGLSTPSAVSSGTATPASQNYWASGVTNANGEFAFPGIPAGTYEIGVSPPTTRSDLGSIARISGVALTAQTTVRQHVTLPRQTAVTPPPTQEPLTIYHVNPSGSFDEGKSIWIAWQTNKPATARVDYGASQSFGSAAESTPGSYANNHSIQLSGLTPNTTYYFSVTSRDHDGNTASSPIYSFQTKHSSVSAPFGIKIDSLFPRPDNKSVPATHTMVSVEFNKPLLASSVSKDSITVKAIGAANSLNATITTSLYGMQLQLFESLQPDSTYEVLIRGGLKSDNGETINSNYSYTFTTRASGTAGTSVIKGKVTDHRGSPIADATVSLSNASNTYFTNTKTTAFGEYAFRDIQANTYVVQAHPSPKQQGIRSSEPVTIGISASETKEQHFTLYASQFMIKGYVRFPDATPVADAIVEAWRKDGPGSVSAYVDANGAYCMSVSPGVWMLSLSSRVALNFFDVYSVAPQSACPTASSSVSGGVGNIPFASGTTIAPSSTGVYQQPNP
ncbi:fibronectin type III domain-containing protein, partial [Candidatus Uhrbacteria bacterium]|nr:fibronectin type III domain-containing protein [Candidatus Uhrbacteria bacterium]